MKRSILVVLIMSFCVGNVFSQVFSRVGIKGGLVKANQDMLNIASDHNEDTGYVSNVVFGGFIVHNISSHFKLINEINYKKAGTMMEMAITNETGPEPVGYIKSYHTLDYFTAPVLLQFILLENKITPFLLCGLSYNRYLSYSFDAEYSNSIASQQGDELEAILRANWCDNVYEKFTKNTFSYIIGAGFTWQVNEKINVDLECRFNRDLNSSLNNAVFNVKTYSFEIMSGISVRLR